MISISLAILGVPLLLGLLLLWAPLRPLVIRSLGVAPMPGLLLLPAAWSGTITTATLPGGWTLVLDQPGAMMLAASTLLWIIGGFAIQRWLAGREGQASFALWWLLTLAGSLGVFLAGDLVSFYALYALASLPAYGLIAADGSAEARRAGRITLAAALVGEALLLAAFVLMAAATPEQNLAIAAAVNALPAAPSCGLVIALLVAGFGLKIGLVPLHGWMPLSYSAGPLAATAVLSGATSKAAVIGFVRFLPLDRAMPFAGGVILLAGLIAAVYGAVLGLTQKNPRSVLAYSSVSQLGQMMAVLGAGLAAGTPGAATVVAFYAVYHVLTKGGLFLMLGSEGDGGSMPRWQMLLGGALALGFAGLPLTGGALGKLAIKDVVGSGVVGLLFSVAAIGSTVLMLHFLRLARRTADRGRPDATLAAWLQAAATATFLPWILFASATGVPATYTLRPSIMLELAWPVALGALLAWALAAAGTQLPRLPPGDIGAGLIGLAERAGARASELAARMEQGVRQWPVSTLIMALAVSAFLLLQSWTPG